MKLAKASLRDCITPDAIVDNRGFFAQLYHGQEYAAQGLDFAARFAQMFQWDPPLGKMVRVTYGHTFSLAVDIRKKSPTFGRYFSIELSRENQLSLYAPPGFAYGFCSLEDDTPMQYLYDAIFMHRLSQCQRRVERPVERSADRNQVAASRRCHPFRKGWNGATT